LLIEPAATNLALHSRDLADVVWVKVNTTAAKTAIGADGVASGATTLTASAASGTVLQTIVSASSARIFSAHVRRRTGTGTVEMTQNNGTTWTPITLTDSFQRFVAPTGTITNPIVGFRIVTSGDAIDVDFTQQEVGAIATSAIPTAATAITRNADVIIDTAVSGLIGQTQGTIYAEVDLKANAAERRIISVTSGAEANRIIIWTLGTTLFVSFNSATSINLGAFPIGALKIAVGYTISGGSTTHSISTNGAAVVTGTSAVAPTGLNQINLGSSTVPALFLNDRISAAAIYTSRLSDTELASLTTL
jgi:hypothetical protein